MVAHQTHGLLLTEIKQRAQVIRHGDQHDRLGQHIGGVVDKGVGECRCAGDRKPRPDGSARDHVADVTQHADQQRAGGKRERLIFDGAAEDAAKPHHGEGEDVVKQDDGNDGLPGGEIGKVIQPQQLLQGGVNKTAAKPPQNTVAVGKQHDGEHGCQRDRAAVRQLGDLQHRKHGGKCHKQGCLDKAARSFCLFHKRPPE